jgi:Zn-dependent metalloprotease
VANDVSYQSLMGKPILNMYFAGNQANRDGYTFKVKNIVYDSEPVYKNKMAHVHLQMYYNGIHVIGGDSVVHIDAATKAIKDFTKTMKYPIKTTPSEVSAAQSQVQAQPDGNVEVVFYSYAGGTALAWDITKSGIAPDQTPMVVHYIVDTEKGTTLLNFSETKTLQETGWPTKNLTYGFDGVDSQVNNSEFNCSSVSLSNSIGQTMFSGLVDLSTGSDGYHDFLLDIDRCCASTAMYIDAYLGCPGDLNHENVPGIHGGDVWGDRSVHDKFTSAADAHYGHAATYDFYKNVFGRQGVYDNEIGVHSRVHYGKGYNNAFWRAGNIFYGDGDGTKILPLTSLEVAAHEFSHGVIEATADLIYYGESGGLNEATSDIMAILVDYNATNRGFYNPNYLLGDQLFIQPGSFFRSMFKPSSDGRSYDCYCSSIGSVDVHYSSGVANHFFYLLAEGTWQGTPSPTCEPGDCREATGTKTLTGIGRDKAGKIWYRALTRYFLPFSNYADARLGTIKAASFLFGSTSKELKAVKDAWTAVNVFF